MAIPLFHFDMDKNESIFVLRCYDVLKKCAWSSYMRFESWWTDIWKSMEKCGTTYLCKDENLVIGSFFGVNMIAHSKPTEGKNWC